MISAEVALSQRLGADPALAFAVEALDWRQATRLLEPWCAGGVLETAELVRHKVGKRALIRYTFQTPFGRAQLYGKIRAKGTDLRTHALQRDLWCGSFGDASLDGISVAEPLGVLEPWRMTLQRAVPGTGLEELIAGEPAALGMRVARAAHKLHCSGVAKRRHTLADELAMLRRQLLELAAQRPQWEVALVEVFERCVKLSRSLPAVPEGSLHRDFYPEQLKLTDTRTYILDLDLCAVGDPALDIGNLTAHLSEASLRKYGHVQAYEGLEDAVTEAFCELSGVSPKAVATYHTLSLARHLAISWRIRERRHVTERLLEQLLQVQV